MTKETPRGASSSPPARLHPIARLPAEWQEWMALRGEPRFRAQQIFRWIHRRGVFEAEHMSDLPVDLRRALAEDGLAAVATVTDVRRSKDGTRKLLLAMRDGARVECVLIPMSDDAGEDADAAVVESDEDEASSARRVTLCISTQVGCAMGCVFCASGRAGLVRGLEPEEIVSQVLLARGYLEPDEELRNLVFMGMGEPLHRYDRTARALWLLGHPDGLAIGPRRITVSTVGLIPGIERLGRDFGGKIGLALSLHAPNDAIRDRIVPMNRSFPFDSLLHALRAYPLPKRRRITIEYTLIAGENDRLEHARELARCLRGLRVKINLIPMNPVSGSSLRAPDAQQVDAFRQILADAGYSCFVRKRRGDDVDAACGQLALKENLVRTAAK